MDLAIPHALGLDLVGQSDLFTKEALESFEEHFTWLDEILKTAKAAFQSSRIQVLPKTPSAKQRRVQRKQSELPSFISRSSICVGKTLHFSETDTSTSNDENIPPGEESNCNTSCSYTTRSTRQRALQVSKTRKQPPRGKSKRSSNLTSPKNDQVCTSDTENSVSPSKTTFSLQKSSTDPDESKIKNNLFPSCPNTVKISPNHSVASSDQCEKQVSPVDSENRVDNSSYVIESENPSLNIPKIDDSQNCQDTPKIDGSQNCQDTAKIDDSQNCQDTAKIDSQNCQDIVPIKNTGETGPDYGVPSDVKTSTINSCNSEVSTQARKASSVEVPQASSPERPRTRTRQMQRQVKAATTTIAALNDDNQTACVSRPCTRSRARKRRSEEVEDVFNTDTKRHCAEEVKESVSTQELEEDADVEDSEDESEAKIKTLINVYTAPSSLCTPKQNGGRSFLLNSSYSLANRSFDRNNYSLGKFVRNGTLTGSAQKNNTQSRLKILSNFGNFKSFLKKTATPIRSVTSQEIIELKKRELENKLRNEKERMMIREKTQQLKLDKQKKKREEHTRKVAETRQIKEIQEQAQKNKKTKKLETLTFTDRIREEKLQEEKERLRLRLKKQQEAEERRNMEKERNRKRKEQEEQQMRYQSMLQKKEFEEQERLKRVAEEKRKFEEQKERKLEAERDKIDLEKRRHFEEREKERIRCKVEREKEMSKQRAEHERNEKQKTQELALERIREMERERLLYEQSLQEKKLEKDERIQKLLSPKTTCQTVASHNTTITIENSTSCSKSEKKLESYEMTPQRSSYSSYDINDMKSDDSTDEESNPQKPIPKWAQGPELKIALCAQYYNPPNLDKIFLPIEIPDLNELFAKKKARFNHRSSSAHWDTPILRSHIPSLH